MNTISDIKAGAYEFTGVSQLNVLLGKNGCGKSTALREIESRFSRDPRVGKVRYVTPERGGLLQYQAHIDQNIANEPNWLANTRRVNQLSEFRQQSVALFNQLELRTLRRIERDSATRADHSVRFDSVIDSINRLLDYIELERADRGFLVRAKGTKGTKGQLDANALSSGECELVSLAIDILAFGSEVIEDKYNLLLLDEPDLHLHPDLQDRLGSFIVDRAQMDSFAVIAATHSTSLIRPFVEASTATIGFMARQVKQLEFKKASVELRRLVPVFGAHPLSSSFTEEQLLLVEGEDDERIWQRAVRSAGGQLRVRPREVGGVACLNGYEISLDSLLTTLYDSAVGFSLRDGDGLTSDLDDLPRVVRMRLNCRDAENLLLTDEVLASLGTNWGDLEMRLRHWYETAANHPHHDAAAAFLGSGANRQTGDIKQLRNDLMFLIGSDKTWEVAVGSVLGKLRSLQFSTETGSVFSFLGPKILRHLYGIEIHLSETA